MIHLQCPPTCACSTSLNPESFSIQTHRSPNHASFHSWSSYLLSLSSFFALQPTDSSSFFPQPFPAFSSLFICPRFYALSLWPFLSLPQSSYLFAFLFHLVCKTRVHTRANELCWEKDNHRLHQHFRNSCQALDLVSPLRHFLFPTDCPHHHLCPRNRPIGVSL